MYCCFCDAQIADMGRLGALRRAGAVCLPCADICRRVASAPTRVEALALSEQLMERVMAPPTVNDDDTS